MRLARMLVIGVAATAAVGLAAAPAVAAPTDTTTVTFDVTAGTLDIDAPASADLGAGAPGTTIAGSLGAVTVTDARASGDASWEASVTSTVFTTGTGTPSQTILATEVEYWSGPATATTGNGTFTPGQATSDDAEPLDNVTPVVAFSHVGGTGNNSATWNPGIIINVPLDAEAGTYTGTVTHSVA
ncbi:hypothetical protein [Plantactinospora sp. BB1]|uniref:hypothetical protein n=1 Tax=Plantactinospora sp. BB1 TaxID=2071627 RepID=UPI001F23C196|nr:hypothetical protein [Plantactinospora sp. BB1]